MNKYINYIKSNRTIRLSVLATGLLLLSSRQALSAQCPVVIQTFPYFENFEASPGGWTAAGSGSSWAWGTPNKPVIDVAASGLNCWITGGLTGLAYSPGERSFLESPCFNFSGLQNPYIRFQLWWETERQYDGSNLQYSLDDGATWTHIGFAFDTADCRTANWYNSFFITNLDGLSNPRPGWSGNVQPTQGNCLGGQGSGGWVEARHTLPDLAGQPNVRFRFTFGAGTACNDFNGLAIDDLRIEEAPPLPEVVSTSLENPSCGGGADGLAAIVVTGGAPPLTYTWTGGIATGPNAFGLSSGTYVVTITDAVQCALVGSFILVDAPNLVPAALITQASCAGADGSATLTVTGGVPPFTYVWAPAVSGGPAATQLPAGPYSVTVTDSNGCTGVLAFLVNSDSNLELSIDQQENPSCFAAGNGAISVFHSGGAGPYQYSWSPPVATGFSASDLGPGDYGVTVTDMNGCSDSLVATLVEPAALTVEVMTQAACPGTPGGQILATSTSGGTGPYQYALDAGAFGAQSSFGALAGGEYVLRIRDAQDCLWADTLTVVAPPPNPLTLNPDTAVYAGQTVLLSGVAALPGRVIAYQWTPAGPVACDTCAATLATPLQTTSFVLAATDSSGCISTASVAVEVRRSSVYAPNVFMPGSTGLNDRFYVHAGPGVQELETIRIYDRWGSLVYERLHQAIGNLADGWDGTVRGKPAPPGVYGYWIRVLFADGSVELIRGDLTLVR